MALDFLLACAFTQGVPPFQAIAWILRHKMLPPSWIHIWTFHTGWSLHPESSPGSSYMLVLVSWRFFLPFLFYLESICSSFRHQTEPMIKRNYLWTPRLYQRWRLEGITHSDFCVDGDASNTLLLGKVTILCLRPLLLGNSSTTLTAKQLRRLCSHSEHLAKFNLCSMINSFRFCINLKANWTVKLNEHWHSSSISVAVFC